MTQQELAKVFQVTQSAIAIAIKKIQEVMPPQEFSEVISLVEITSENNPSGHKTVIKYRRRILTRKAFFFGKGRVHPSVDVNPI
jgi:hypothetical protein